jgi:hypothetical protein
MIRKPTSGDSEQREHESERARKSSELSAGGSARVTGIRGPTHGGSDGESAHGALPRHGIEDEQGN